jgi:LCP family protein required for cell wall assembly
VGDRPDPTTAAGRRGGRVWGRRAAQVLGGLLVLALVVSASAIAWLDRSIDRVEVQGLGESSEDVGGADADDAADVDDGPRALTVLVLGSDSREDLTPEQRREFRTGDFEGVRTEVISLVRLAPETEEIRILNIPRDSRVERCDGSVGKINGAYEIGAETGVGGATCTVETLAQLTGIVIDHVAIVDFEGFVDVVDGLGGVTMELDEPIRDPGSHLDLPAGCVELDGVDALAFVRARQVDDDFGRIARQQRLVEEIRDQLGEVGVLQDLPRLLRVAEAVARSVELDSSLDFGTIQQLVREHRSTLQGDLDGRAVPGELSSIDGISYVEPDRQRLDQLALWLLTGTDPAQIVADAAPDRGEDDGEARGPDSGQRTLAGETPAGTQRSERPDC